jgi:tungstate transport system substrate-binding protein
MGVGGGRAVVLASTTSTEDSGLFDVLLPAFHDAHRGLRVRLVAVGSGEALALGRRADADVLLVHSPADEEAFMRAGFGTSRRPVMSNDFVIAGPADDPAAVAGTSGADALRRIAAAGAPFVSRGDSSGTHRMELQLWAVAGSTPARSAWYMEVGQGMGDALRIASERAAYVLTDRATFAFLESSLQLNILLEGDSTLLNPYSVITVAGARNARGASAFAEWLVTEAAQSLIGAYGRERFGRPLFEPTH